MACHPYPENMPLECATQLWSLLRDDISNSNQKHQIIHHAWTIIGYGAKLYEQSDPDTPPPIGSSLHNAEFIEALIGCRDEMAQKVYGNDILDFFQEVMAMLDKVLHWFIEKAEELNS